MKLYSFVVMVSQDVVLQDLNLAFLAGRNVFTLAIGYLPGLLDRFELEGIRVLEQHCFDSPETSARDLLLPGEEAAMRGLHAWRSRS